MGKRLLLAGLIVVMALTGCGKKNNSSYKDVPVADIVTAVQEAYEEDYGSMYALSADELESMMGIPADWYDEAVAQIPQMSFSVDTLVVVKAKDGKVKDVQKALEDYRNMLLNDTMQYPANLIKIEASRVDVYGNYVFYTMLGYISMEVEEQGEEAALSAYKDQNQKAITAIESVIIEEK